MKTYTKTEYQAFYKKSDGTWRPIPSMNYTKPELVQYKIEDHNQLAKQHPTIMDYIEDYKIMKRTVTTTYTDWE